jgi:hypothetical protein
MGAPFSLTLSETYVQNIEHNIIVNVLQNYKVLGYYRYVDDIILVYKKQITDINNRQKQFNEINPKLQFTIEKENDNVINFLDVTVIRKPNNVQHGIYRKPTSAGNIIHNTSCHQTEHKMLAISYLIHRMNTYPIQNKTEEENIIKQITIKNQYPEETFHKINSKSQQKKNYNLQRSDKDNIKKWATFTCIGRETRSITKIFKTTNLKVAFKTSNTIQNHLCNLKESNHQKDPYQNSGIYQLTCKECNLKYLGQTDRTFKTRYNEHINAIKSNKSTSRYAQHILDNRYSYGTIYDTMDILWTTREHVRKISYLEKQENLWQYFKRHICGSLEPHFRSYS